MKAVVKTKIGEGFIDYMDFKEPQAGSGQVKIRIAFAGICGTDISIRHNHQWSNPPVILGHEYSGIVEAVGEGVTAFRKGDRVVSETAQIICGTCEYCMSGNYLMCGKRLSIGYGTNGAFAEYIVVRQEIVHRIPDVVSLEEAAMCEPSAVAYHAVFDHIPIRPVHTVLVLGPGAIGQLVSQIAKSTGARVILCGTKRDAKRLEIAAALGIETLTTDDFDLPSYIMNETEGKGADVAFDCTGAAPAINQAITSLKRMGKLIQVGLAKSNIDIDYNILPQRQISIIGSFGHVNESWQGVLTLMEKGLVNVKSLISGKYPLDEWRNAFDQAEDLNGVKVLLHP